MSGPTAEERETLDMLHMFRKRLILEDDARKLGSARPDRPTHPDFKGVSDEEVESDLADVRSRIEKILSQYE